VVATRRAVARPVAPENGHIEIGIGAPHEGADVSESAVDVTLGGEKSMNVERTWQRAQLRLQCLVPFLLPACFQLGDGLRESLALREGDESGDELLGQLDVSRLVRTDPIGFLVPGFLRRFPNPGLCRLIVS